MKKLKLVCVLIILFGNVTPLSSQTPGYMGKRFVAGYGFYFSPAVFGSNGQGSSIFGRENGNATDGEFAFNSMHEVFIEAALTKRFALGLSCKFYKTTYDNARDLYVSNTQVDKYGYNTTVSYSGSPDGFYYIHGQNYSLYAKLFNKLYVAPWGRYMMFGINVKKYTCTYDPSEMKLRYNSYSSSYSNYPAYSNFGPEKQKFTKFDVLFGLGRTRIIANRVVLDYGFNANMIAFLSTFFDTVAADNDGVFSANATASNYIKVTSPWRVRGVNRFNVFLKVGVLLF